MLCGHAAVLTVATVPVGGNGWPPNRIGYCNCAPHATSRCDQSTLVMTRGSSGASSKMPFNPSGYRLSVNSAAAAKQAGE